VSKTKVSTSDQIDYYFQNTKEFSMHEKLYWHRLILDALRMANEQEKSKEGKRFRYDFERHKITMFAIKALLPSLEFAHQAHENIVSLLKVQCEKIREAIAIQLDRLLQEYAGNNALFTKENSLKDNPIAGHAEVLRGVRSLHLEEIPALLDAQKKAYTYCCKQLYKACTEIDDENVGGRMSAIRAAWLVEVMLAHPDEIIHVYGAWRFGQIINELFVKDYRTKGEEVDESICDERDKQMLRELSEFHRRSVEEDDKSDNSELSSSHHDHECCDEHEKQP